MKLESVESRWLRCVIAAPGPSLKPFECGWPIIVVQDAYKLIPWADVMYGCDPKWWSSYAGDFKGELWSTHDLASTNDKQEAQDAHGVRCVRGERRNPTDCEFSFDPELIIYGDNSGFQAINLALLFGCKEIILTGFDMKGANQVRPSGEHYERFAKFYENATRGLPSDVQIINATPGSALRCFPIMELADALLLDSTTQRLGGATHG